MEKVTAKRKLFKAKINWLLLFFLYLKCFDIRAAQYNIVHKRCSRIKMFRPSTAQPPLTYEQVQNTCLTGRGILLSLVPLKLLTKLLPPHYVFKYTFSCEIGFRQTRHFGVRARTNIMLVYRQHDAEIYL